MNYNRYKTMLLVGVLTAMALGACGPGPAADPNVFAIETAVAATMAAGEGENPPATASPTLSPTWTIQPLASAAPPETNFTYAGVSFYFNDLLADDITAGVNPGLYDENSLMWSYPEHRSYLFNGWVLSDGFHQPRIQIYNVADFRAINENVAASFDALEGALAADPLNGDDLRVSNLFNAGQLYYSNAKALRFQNGYGARWLSQYGQAYYPVGWPNLFYTFQGFTDDGQYYISIIFPVNHPDLPATNTITIDAAFAENYLDYAAGIQAQLDAETDNSFLPSLVLLDQLVTSLLVGQP
jgi:hypothetical protein